MEGIKQNKQLHSQTARTTRSCLWSKGLFLIEESGRGRRGRNKRYSLYTAGRWLPVPFLPTFSWTPSRCSLFWHFYHFSCQWHWPSARGVWRKTIQKHHKHATSQTADLQNLNIWLSKIAIYYLFVGLFLSFVIEQKPLLFPSVALSSPIPNWTSTGGWLRHSGQPDPHTRSHFCSIKTPWGILMRTLVFQQAPLLPTFPGV